MRRWHWALLAALLSYLAGFAALKLAYLPWRADNDRPLSPRARALYATVFYPLRWAVASLHAGEDEVRVGKLRERDKSHLSLDHLDSLWMISFSCKPSACVDLARLPLGSEVELRFGWALSNDDQIIHPLIRARACEKQDAACDAIRAQQAAALAATKALIAKQDAQHAACEAKMGQDMIAAGFGTIAVFEAAAGSMTEAQIAEVNTPAMRSCRDGHDARFEAAVLDSCQRHHCGDNVGGGCWHIAPAYLTSRSVAVCRAQLLH